MQDLEAQEKVFLVVIDHRDESRHVSEYVSPEEALDEMKELADACQADVCGEVILPMRKESSSHFIGKGQLQELKETCEVLSPDLVIFSSDLKGSYQRNIERELECKVIDRTQLILDIFARRATSAEGKLQVELAQLEYLRPRLVGKGLEMSRLGGGIGTLGPGETKLEVDRRRIDQRIVHLKAELKQVKVSRDVKRKKRQTQSIPSISLVGYTNAGKSTLLNVLTECGQETHDGVFTTLDSLSRKFVLPNHQTVVLSDTIGFIRELPHHLVEAFKVTLEDVCQADLLLHVIDVSHPQVQSLYDSVMNVLKQLDVLETPMIVVLNKIDNLSDQEQLEFLRNKFENSLFISAKQKTNLDELLDEIIQKLSHLRVKVDVMIPFDRMDLIDLAHRKGEILVEDYLENAVHLTALVPKEVVARYQF